MDGIRFDDLTRTLADCTDSRRSTLKLLGATVLGGALARLSLGEAEAACKKVGRRCKRDRNCCDGARCTKRGRCKCLKGRKDCDGDKVCETDVTGDDDNCGACGNVCPDGQVCRDGECECRFGGPLCGGECCFDGETCCDGVCRDLDEDADFCGSCNRSCADNQVCEFGNCCIDEGGSGCTGNRDCCNFPRPLVCGVDGVCFSFGP